MARWRGEEPKRIEPPGWYRCYDAAAWDEPDGQELLMTGGLPPSPELHEYHAQRRWHEAKHTYRQQHPLLATQEFNDIFARRSKRRMT